MPSGRIVGLIVGLVLGIVWMWLGFGAALLTGFLALLGAALGTLVGAVARGDLSYSDLWNDLQGRRHTA
jgi:hypothetical protein